MCGRYTLSTPADLVADFFALAATPELVPRFNIAPTQEAAVVRAAPGGRALHALRWGLVPYWAEDPAIGNRLINARAETAADKPAFRWPMRRRRCLVAADGFYEWRRGPRGSRQPFLFRLRSGEPFAFAGLWDRWRPPAGAPLASFTILTTDANTPVAEIHDRMPVILGPDAFDRWLDPSQHDAKELAPLLVPYPATEMVAFPVSTLVNNPAHDEPECVAPLPAVPAP